MSYYNETRVSEVGPQTADRAASFATGSLMGQGLTTTQTINAIGSKEGAPTNEYTLQPPINDYTLQGTQASPLKNDYQQEVFTPHIDNNHSDNKFVVNGSLSGSGVIGFGLTPNQAITTTKANVGNEGGIQNFHLD